MYKLKLQEIDIIVAVWTKFFQKLKEGENYFSEEIQASQTVKFELILKVNIDLPLKEKREVFQAEDTMLLHIISSLSSNRHSEELCWLEIGVYVSGRNEND